VSQTVPAIPQDKNFMLEHISINIMIFHPATAKVIIPFSQESKRGRYRHGSLFFPIRFYRIERT